MIMISQNTRWYFHYQNLGFQFYKLFLIMTLKSNHRYWNCIEIHPKKILIRHWPHWQYCLSCWYMSFKIFPKIWNNLLNKTPPIMQNLANTCKYNSNLIYLLMNYYWWINLNDYLWNIYIWSTHNLIYHTQ